MTLDEEPRPRRSSGAALVARALRMSGARAVIAVAGLGTSVLLVLVLLATYHSVEIGIRAYVGQPAVDLWVAPRGTDNLIRSASLLPDVLVEDIAAMEGVAEAAPVLRSFMAAEPLPTGHAPVPRGITLLAIGYRTPAAPGGPPHLVAGRRPAAPGEVVLDRAAAHRLALGVGSTFLLNGSTVTVAGLTARTNLVSTQLVFLDAARVAALSGYRGSASFIAVRLRPGSSVADVGRRIEAELPGVTVHPRDAFVTRSEEEVFAGFRPVQALVSAVGLLTASALVALLVLTLVEDRRREIAVLLALGASGRAVTVAVLRQVLTLVCAGVASGAATAIALTAALTRWVPTIDAAPRLADAAAVMAAFAAAALLGALLPLIRIRRADPVEAFRP